MNENQRIGERLEAERKRLGYTAIEVYNSLDIAQTTYKGQRRIRIYQNRKGLHHELGSSMQDQNGLR